MSNINLYKHIHNETHKHTHTEICVHRELCLYQYISVSWTTENNKKDLHKRNYFERWHNVHNIKLSYNALGQTQVLDWNVLSGLYLLSALISFTRWYFNHNLDAAIVVAHSSVKILKSGELLKLWTLLKSQQEWNNVQVNEPELISNKAEDLTRLFGRRWCHVMDASLR